MMVDMRAMVVPAMRKMLAAVVMRMRHMAGFRVVGFVRGVVSVMARLARTCSQRRRCNDGDSRRDNVLIVIHVVSPFFSVALAY
jgi:hypothetical protein